MTDPAVLSALGRIEAALANLAEDVEALAQRGKLTADERAQLERMLPAIAPTVGDAAFTIGDGFADLGGGERGADQAEQGEGC